MGLKVSVDEQSLQAKFDFIEEIEREQTFQIHSTYPTIDGIQITMQKEKREYLLNANGMNSAPEVIASLKKIVEESEDDIYNNKKMILNKLDNLNMPANSSSFAACFKQLGVDLDDDLKILDNRNKFLHGRLPFEDEFALGKSQELRFVVFKYHFLLSILVLKFCGYSGYVKDGANFYSVFSGRERAPSRKLFKMI